MYHDSVDALAQLLMNGQEGGPLEASDVASISSKIGVLKNGISHCSVQVRFENGAEYRIEAFGEEAEELHRMAVEHTNSCVLLP
ncbi:MAG TPA: hypothetical protein VLA68_05450 [Nitrososphaera sp.]|nr:hypothetical protein [Nitrososphaera sp.]